MFAYCNNNPIIRADISGCFPWHIVIGGAIGGGLSMLGTWTTGGTAEDVLNAGIRGFLFGSMTTAFPSTAPYIASIDAVWTVIEVWGNGASIESGVLSGLLQLLGSGQILHTGDMLSDILVDVIFGAGVDLTKSGVIILLSENIKPYSDRSSAATPHLAGIGGGPKNAAHMLC